MNEELKKIFIKQMLLPKEELAMQTMELLADKMDLQSKIDKANEILNRPQFEYNNIPCNYEEDIKELKDILKEDK